MNIKEVIERTKEFNSDDVDDVDSFRALVQKDIVAKCLLSGTPKSEIDEAESFIRHIVS